MSQIRFFVKRVKRVNKSKKSIYNAASSMLLTIFNGIFGIVVIQSIVQSYGSDFNGLNSTVNQFINMILVVEGGFTLAINVALFKPFSENDVSKANAILIAGEKIFKKIGLLFLLIGFIGSVLSVFVIKTDVSTFIVFCSFFFMVLSTFVNLFFATKYRLIIQTDQKEYIINIIQIITLVASQLLIIYSIKNGWGMLSIRLIMMIFSIISSIMIIIYSRNFYSIFNFKSKEPDYKSIKGTGDIFVQKITSMLYGAFPTIFIASTVGTVFTSVYIVYNSIFALVKNVIYSLVNAPRMGFGKLIIEREKKYVFEIFIEYEYIILNVLLLSLMCTKSLIVPFIKLYTRNMNDANYENLILIYLMLFITFFEIIHIPSGNIINMCGAFKIGRKIQTVSAIILVVSMVIFNIFFGFIGTLVGVLVTSIVLAILEIYYVHVVYFESTIFSYFKRYTVIILFCFLISYVQDKLIAYEPYNYFYLFLLALLIFTIDSLSLLGFNLLFKRELTKKILKRLKILRR